MNGSLEEKMEDVIACDIVCLVGVVSSPVMSPSSVVEKIPG